MMLGKKSSKKRFSPNGGILDGNESQGKIRKTSPQKEIYGNLTKICVFKVSVINTLYPPKFNMEPEHDTLG